jgi:hypothetical protein
VASEAHTVLFIVLLAGCGGGACPPPNAEGGTATERALIDLETRAFLGELIPDVCIQRVVVRDLKDDLEGRYSPLLHRVEIEPGLHEALLGEVVRHELCHALQDQAGLDVSGDTWHLESSGAPDGHDEEKESFAFTCAKGPLTAHLFSETCPGDMDGVEAWRLIGEQFRTPAALLERELLYTPIASLPVSTAGEDPWIVAEGTVEGTVRIELHDQGQIQVWFLDPWTGDPAPVGTPIASAEPEAPSFGTHVSAGAEAGGAELLVSYVFAANGALAVRLVYRDAAGVTPTCYSPGEQVFAVDGELWSAILADGQVSWGTWHAL